MSRFAKHVSIVSTVALMAVGGAGLAVAQEQDRRDRDGGCVGNMENCAPQELRRQRGDDDGDNNRRWRFRDNDDNGRVTRNDNDNDGRVRESRSEWRFESNRHERRRHRDDRFRFYFGGYYYPE